MSRYLISAQAARRRCRSDGFQKLMRNHMTIAEKDLAWVLSLAREAEITLPVAALVSQLMARLYGVEDPKRR